MPESPTPLLGRDLMTKLGTTVLQTPGQIPSCLPGIEADIDLEVWDAPGIDGDALTATLIRIHFKEPQIFPCRRQYPLKPETQQGLIPIINNLKKTGLLRTCNSPYNTPILGILKPSRD